MSVKVSYWATARLLGDVPATVFVPRPKVVSSIIEITRRAEPAVAPDVPAEELFALVRQAFGQRRKMLRRSLADRTSPEIFSRANISPENRPEQLDVEQWGRLARAVLNSRESDNERAKHHE